MVFLTIKMLPLFPLELVVYPGEQLPLHIFEDRYQQLIRDCKAEGIPFGIPAYIDKKLAYGTELTLTSIEKEYPSGAMDVLCLGKRVFKIETFYPELSGKLYAGGKVTYFEEDANTAMSLQEELLQHITTLYTELTIERPPVFHTPFTSYQVAHKVGLSIAQEYYLLTIHNELERLMYLIGHLKGTIPVVREMNRTKAVIQMNGHYKNFDPLDFEDYHL